MKNNDMTIIKQIENPERTYLISDLHLNHRNIIKYCGRPFRDVAEMNRTLVRNWNATINPDDIVYYLGDLCFGNPWSWLKRLAGRIIFIRGSHDHRIPRGLTSDYVVIGVGGLSFYLVHKFWDAPADWGGCVIHGHDHNNQPFIDDDRVNVSVEAVGYKPISLARVVEAVKASGKN